ncbi:MAG: hypothetical protein Q9195_006417 [Heterodermia aff. obscurata]
MPTPQPRAIFFDFMGTCLDWHTSAVSALPASIPPETRSELALAWRQAYFDSNAARLAAHLPPEDIDLTLQHTLSALLSSTYPSYLPLFSSDTKRACVAAWHSMRAWPDVLPALTALKAAGHSLFVFANGTTRLQLDLCRSAGLTGVFDMCFSSELLGVYKPARESYERVLELVRVSPDEAVQVAAHAYDTRGARAVGMRTVYVRRWTDDVREDMGVVRGENEVFLEGMEGLVGALGGL